MPPRHPETLKMGCAATILDRRPRAGRRPVFAWCFELEEPCGLDGALHPKLLPPCLGSTQGRLFRLLLSSDAEPYPEATRDPLSSD